MSDLNPIDQSETRNRTKLESALEDVLRSVDSFTSSELIESERNNRIVDECDQVRKALQGLFDSYSTENVILYYIYYIPTI